MLTDARRQAAAKNCQYCHSEALREETFKPETLNDAAFIMKDMKDRKVKTARLKS